MIDLDDLDTMMEEAEEQQKMYEDCDTKEGREIFRLASNIIELIQHIEQTSDVEE